MATVTVSVCEFEKIRIALAVCLRVTANVQLKLFHDLVILREFGGRDSSCRLSLFPAHRPKHFFLFFLLQCNDNFAALFF